MPCDGSEQSAPLSISDVIGQSAGATLNSMIKALLQRHGLYTLLQCKTDELFKMRVCRSGRPGRKLLYVKVVEMMRRTDFWGETLRPAWRGNQHSTKNDRRSKRSPSHLNMVTRMICLVIRMSSRGFDDRLGCSTRQGDRETLQLLHRFKFSLEAVIGTIVRNASSGILQALNCHGRKLWCGIHESRHS